MLNASLASATLPHPALQGRPYRATISDTEGAVLPARGSLIEEQDVAEFVVQLATQLGEQAAAGGGGGGGNGGAALDGGEEGSAASQLGSGPSSGWLGNASYLRRGTSTLD